MVKNVSILAAAVIVIALPFLLRKPDGVSEWKPGDPILVIITPHNEAIRYEFGQAFSKWHQARHGAPVKIDWRSIGGTTEIARYLVAEYVVAVRAWWTGQGKPWPAGAGESIVDRRFNTKAPPALTRQRDESDDEFAQREKSERARWEKIRDIYLAFRQTDDAAAFSSKMDLFFGGGEYDHARAFQEGLTVAPWPEDQPPEGLFALPDGTELIPARISGEVWRTPTLFGNVVSTFGICYNLDRLRDLGIASPPSRWDDLADPVYFRQLGVADPTKSGSIAKAFELIIHQKCHEAVSAAGFTPDMIRRYEEAIAAARLPPGEMPEGVPAAYQEAIERGWADGLRLVQRIGANARYFTDSASKVPIDVSMGDSTAGLAIDFYGRYQAQASRAPDGAERMVFVTPEGGSGISCDPISLLRGAENRQIAVRFIEFALSEAGQRIWTYRPGSPGGPEKFALRRIPIRRDFFPSDHAEIMRRHRAHLKHAADNLADPRIDPYALAKQFTYYSRWTGQHFGIHRDLVKAMCLDSAGELKAAWQRIMAQQDPARKAEALRILGELPDKPESLTWRSALAYPRVWDRLDYMREWTLFYRNNYARARALAETRVAQAPVAAEAVP